MRRKKIINRNVGTATCRSMMQMVKLDIATLKKAYEGKSAA
ncbi:hypothetical protein [Bradyrhizobium sp.]|nr:hypothetical protein [Bradyrhizobium sp.]